MAVVQAFQRDAFYADAFDCGNIRAFQLDAVQATAFDVGDVATGAWALPVESTGLLAGWALPVESLERTALGIALPVESAGLPENSIAHVWRVLVGLNQPLLHHWGVLVPQLNGLLHLWTTRQAPSGLTHVWRVLSVTPTGKTVVTEFAPTQGTPPGPTGGRSHPLVQRPRAKVEKT